MAEMQGKVVIITGASSGIGQACAHKFASNGANVVLVARSENKLRALSEELHQLHEQALAVAADLTNDSHIEDVISQTVSTFGGVDVLINAAGIIGSGSIETTTKEEWDAMLHINTRAPFTLMQCAMPHLVQTQGNVVNVSSVTGVRAFPNVLAYCVSKAALDQLTRCAALEMAPKGVRINAINPGVVQTNLHKQAGMDEETYAQFLEHSKTTHPLGRVGQSEEAAELIYFLASPRAGWITGVTYEFDGGRALTCAR